ncbi:MAG: hypothetical protein U1E16_04525 [Hyphomicrobiales bacterium]
MLPQYLRRDQLIGGNALIELGTFVTILLGTLFGGFLVLDNAFGRGFLAITIVVLAVIAWICAFLMPPALGDRFSITFDWNIPRATKKLLSYARSARTCSGR